MRKGTGWNINMDLCYHNVCKNRGVQRNRPDICTLRREFIYYIALRGMSWVVQQLHAAETKGLLALQFTSLDALAVPMAC